MISKIPIYFLGCLVVQVFPLFIHFKCTTHKCKTKATKPLEIMYNIRKVLGEKEIVLLNREQWNKWMGSVWL